MKKITLLAALLGTVYFSNAQVGIGTATPSTSAMLEIAGTNKGVLIPRVSLTDSETVLATGVNQENSLLVYNVGARGATGKEVKDGFYYWSNTGSTASTIGKWIRIVNQADLDAIVAGQTTDIAKIKALLDAAYGSNNLGNSPTTGTFGGMVFAPGATGTPAKIEYVKWNPTLNGPTTGGYEKIDITSIISSLINANESNTSLISDTDKKYQYYISEEYIKAIKLAANGVYTAPTQTAIDGWDATPPTGVFMIEFVKGISNNFLELSTTVTNIPKPGGGFYNVKEYIEFLAQNTNANGDTKIVLTGAGTPADPYVAKLQRWDTTLTPAAWVDVDNSAFKTIVKDNETKSVVKTLDGRTFYFSETSSIVPADTTTAAQATATGVVGVYELHMGNTGYTTAIIPAAQNPNGDLIPANTLYYITTAGVKIAIPMNDIVYQGISQFTANQINSTKLKLGDNLSSTSFTGDTITVGGDTHYIYRGVYSTIVTANEANTSGVTLGQSGSKILSIDLRYDGGMVASVTDVTLTGATLDFKIGTGKMYNVLGAANITADVIVEFASATAPAFVTP